MRPQRSCSRKSTCCEASPRDCWIGEVAAAEARAKQTDDAVTIATLLETGEIRQHSIEEGLDRLMRDFNLHVGEAEAILLAQSRFGVRNGRWSSHTLLQSARHSFHDGDRPAGCFDGST